MAKKMGIIWVWPWRDLPTFLFNWILPRPSGLGGGKMGQKNFNQRRIGGRPPEK